MNFICLLNYYSNQWNYDIYIIFIIKNMKLLDWYYISKSSNITWDIFPCYIENQ